MDRTLNLLAVALGLSLIATPLAAQTDRVPLSEASAGSEGAEGEPVPLVVPDMQPALFLYNVADITGSQASLPAPEAPIDGDPAVLLEYFEELEALRGQAKAAMGALEQVVRTYIEPPLQPGLHELRALGDDRLALQGNAEQYAWLTDFLQTQRSFHSLVQIRTHFWVGPPGMLADFGLPRGTQHLFEDSAAIDALLARARSSGHELVSSPELLTYPRQLGSASVLNATSYVSEWILEHVEPGHQPVLDPVIEVVREGVVVTARAVPLANASWSVDANVHLSSLMRPIPTEQVQVGDGSYFAQISRPTVADVKMHSRFSVGSGGGALFVTHDSVEDRDVIVLVQVATFDPGDDFGSSRSVDKEREASSSRR